MPRLSEKQQQARQRILRLTARTLPPNQLGEAVLDALCLAIPSDGQSLFVVDPESLLFTRVLAGTGGPYAESRLQWLRHTYLIRQPGQCNPPGMMRMGLSAVGLHEELGRCIGAPAGFLDTDSPRAWWRRFHEVEGVPFRNVLAASFAADGRWVAGLTLVRADPRVASFQPTDVMFLRAVAPRIGQTIRAALTRERAERASPSPNEPPDAAIGVLALGRDGRVRFRNAAADRWIGALRETWMPTALGIPQLPTAVWTALAALRVAPGRLGAPALRVPYADGVLRVEASWGVDDTDDTAMIVFAPEQPPTMPHLPDDWPLTPQERRVLTSVARGLTNRQIAAQLTVSEHTIVSHLAHAYEKLGVHSRTQLLARLFQQAYLPEMSP